MTLYKRRRASACAAYHDAHVSRIDGHRRIEFGEIWSFVYAKERAVPRAKKAPREAGDVWTFTVIDAGGLQADPVESGERWARRRVRAGFHGRSALAAA